MQHVEPSAQVAIKQRILEDALERIGGVKPSQVMAPIHGPYWGYRHRARLTVKQVDKKGGILVGFHEKKSGYVADIRQCDVLPKHVSDVLLPTRKLIESLSTPRRIPQIEVAVGDQQTVFVLRHMEPLTDQDKVHLRAFGQTHHITWWLQPAGPDSVHPLDAPSTQGYSDLAYWLPAYAIRMPFKPTDFTQVNPSINQVMIAKAIQLLDPQPTDRVLDLFCGLGNFSLPIARFAQFVMGVEGSASLTRQAQHNAQLHGLDHTEFVMGNLFEGLPKAVQDAPAFDRWLIDPPRDGAWAVVQALAEQAHSVRPKRIVYVSCNPATLARDAGVLVQQAGYTLAAAGVINMFSHTGHVESIAVFNLS